LASLPTRGGGQKSVGGLIILEGGTPAFGGKKECAELLKKGRLAAEEEQESVEIRRGLGGAGHPPFFVWGVFMK